MGIASEGELPPSKLCPNKETGRSGYNNQSD
jgi:hypothetical protein